MSEHETEKEMPTVGGAGRDVLGTIAALNVQAKEIRKKSERIKQQEQQEKEAFVEEIDLGSSSSSVEVEEFVPPTPS